MKLLIAIAFVAGLMAQQVRAGGDGWSSSAWPSEKYPFQGYVQAEEACKAALKRVCAVGIAPTYGAWWEWRVGKQHEKLTACKENLRKAIQSKQYLDVSKRSADGDWSDWLNANPYSLEGASWQSVAEVSAAAGVPGDWWTTPESAIYFDLSKDEKGWKYVTNICAKLTETWYVAPWTDEILLGIDPNVYTNEFPNGVDPGCVDVAREFVVPVTTEFDTYSYPDPIGEPPNGPATGSEWWEGEGPWNGLPVWWVPHTLLEAMTRHPVYGDAIHPSITNLWNCDPLTTAEIGTYMLDSKVQANPSFTSVTDSNFPNTLIFYAQANWLRMNVTAQRKVKWHTGLPPPADEKELVNWCEGSIPVHSIPAVPENYVPWPNDQYKTFSTAAVSWDFVPSATKYKIRVEDGSPGGTPINMSEVAGPTDKKRISADMPLEDEYNMGMDDNWDDFRGWSNQEFTATSGPRIHCEPIKESAVVRTSPAQWWWDETGASTWNYSEDLASLQPTDWVMLTAQAEGSRTQEIISASQSIRLDPDILSAVGMPAYTHYVYGMWSNESPMIVLTSVVGALSIPIAYDETANLNAVVTFSATQAVSKSWGSTNSGEGGESIYTQCRDLIGEAKWTISNEVVSTGATNVGYEEHTGDYHTIYRTTVTTVDITTTTNETYLMEVFLTEVDAGGYHALPPVWTIDPVTGEITESPSPGNDPAWGLKTWHESAIPSNNSSSATITSTNAGDVLYYQPKYIHVEDGGSGDSNPDAWGDYEEGVVSGSGWRWNGLAYVDYFTVNDSVYGLDDPYTIPGYAYAYGSGGSASGTVYISWAVPEVAYTNTVITNSVFAVQTVGWRGDRWEDDCDEWVQIPAVPVLPHSDFVHTQWIVWPYLEQSMWVTWNDYPSECLYYGPAAEAVIPFMRRVQYATLQTDMTYLWEDCVNTTYTNNVPYNKPKMRAMQWDWTWEVERKAAAGDTISKQVFQGPSVIKWDF
ncbi:MAG: hypothetical protein ACOYOU_03360 [Kiritimatiellia bacterium]